MTTPDLNQLAAAKLMRVDVPLNEPRVRIEGESTSCSLVIGTQLVHAGHFEIDVYESEARHAEEQLLETATAEDWRRVRIELEFAEAEARKPDGNPRPYIPSLAAAFREVMKRDMRPLKSLRRVSGDKGKKAA